jgi:single-strand DNA-binding protein
MEPHSLGSIRFVSVSLATTRSFKHSEGSRQSETEWHRITCFNGVGKCVAEHVAKGAMIMVTGRIHYTKWTDQNGTDRYGCEIIAEQVDLLAKAKEATNPRSGAPSSAVRLTSLHLKEPRNIRCGALCHVQARRQYISKMTRRSRGKVLAEGPESLAF